MSRKNFFIVLFFFVLILIIAGYLLIKQSKEKNPDYQPPEIEIEKEKIIKELIEAPVPSGEDVKTREEIIKDLTEAQPPEAGVNDQKTDEEVLDSLINLKP